jgi:hypothetical protein
MLAMLAGLGAAAAPAAHADLRTYRVAADRVPIAGPGGGGRTARLRSRVSFPADWRRAGDPAQGLTIIERTRSCRYRVAVRLRVVTAAAADAAALVLAERPAAPPRGLLDAGVRGTAAWRVVKRPGAGRIRLAATWARTTVHTRPDGLPPDLHAYEQIVVSATAFAGDRCATGNYRDVVGPEIGDALATARVTSFIDGAVSRS